MHGYMGLLPGTLRGRDDEGEPMRQAMVWQRLSIMKDRKPELAFKDVN
jgi:hypothetical protein